MGRLMGRHVPENGLRELIGETVWLRTPYSDVNKGTVQEVRGMGHAMVHIVKGPGGAPVTVCAHANDIFQAKEDLIGALISEADEMEDKGMAEAWKSWIMSL